jgi:hypothetical protein
VDKERSRPRSWVRVLVRLHTNTILLEALSAGTITYLSWREERHLTASLSLNTDLGRLLTHFLSLWIRPCTRDLIVLTQSDKDSNSGSWSTNSIGRKIFNYKEAFQDIYIEEYLKNPLTCDCSHSPFQYNPSGHVITGEDWFLKYGGISFTTSFLLRMLLMLIASIPLLANTTFPFLLLIPKKYNYKEALQNINIEEYLKNPLTCDCSHSPFQYNPSGHVITGDLNIIQHESPKGDFSTRDLIVLTQSDKDSNSGSWSTSLFIHLLA